MTLRVAVDFGTSSTCVVASVNGREPQVVVIDGQPLMPSAVYAAADGTLFVGQEAERQAAVDPSRYEPNPKRRIDEGELLLGDAVLRVTDVVHAVLRRAVTEARRLAGDAGVALLVLTHPADWGVVRTRLLRQAAGGLAHEVALVPEPVAAAVYHAATFSATEVNQERTVEFSGRPGDTLAVLDLGGGTVDVSVVRRSPGTEDSAFSPRNTGPGGETGLRRGGFHVLATRGDPSFGGADVDQLLLEHIGSMVASADPDAWRQLVEGRELPDRRRRRVLRQDVRGAKETLSRHTYTDVPMPPPFADAHVTREDLERLIVSPLGRAVELARAAIDEAGVRPQQLTAIFLVGGSSRIPMVSRLVHERLGVVPTTLDQPETVVARGALRAVLVNPDRTGVLPGATPRPAFSGLNAFSASPDGRTEVVHPGDLPPRPAGFGPSALPPGAPPPSAFSGLNASRRPPSGPGAAGLASPASPPRGQPVAAVPWHQPDTEATSTTRQRRRRRIFWLAGIVVLVAAAVVATLLFVVRKPTAAPSGKTIAQYEYQFVIPQDWTQTGGKVEDRKVVVRPTDAQTGDDLIAVQEFQMDYDATADRNRLVEELRTEAQAGPQYSGFTADLQFAGKTLIYYRQLQATSTVDWYVAVQGRVRVHVGCQYAVEALQQRVQSACQQIVQTLQING